MDRINPERVAERRRLSSTEIRKLLEDARIDLSSELARNLERELLDILIREDEIDNIRLELDKIVKNKMNSFAPRKLTQEEIRDIVDSFPHVFSGAKETAESIRTSMQAKFSKILAKLKITPLGIPDLKREIIRQFKNSIIKPGTGVGYTAAEALGGPIMQMSMNTFHASGQLNEVTTGVTRIFDLLEVRKELKIPSNRIKFTDPTITFDRIITQKRGDIVGASVGDLVKEYDVYSRAEFLELSDFSSSRSESGGTGRVGSESGGTESGGTERGEPWWYGLFRQVVRNDFDVSNSKYILRLKFHKDVLYSHNITLEKIARVIESDTPPAVVCVYSPEHLGIIDVHPVEKTIGESLVKAKINVNEDLRSLTFISQIVTPNLDQIQVGGVKGIKVLVPSVIPIWSIVGEEIKNSDGTWSLVLDPFRMVRSGLTGRNVERLCLTVGMEIISSSSSPSSYPSSLPSYSPSSTSEQTQGVGETIRVRLPERSREMTVKEERAAAKKTAHDIQIENLKEEFKGKKIEKSILEAKFEDIAKIVEEAEKEAERKAREGELKVTPGKWVQENIRLEEEKEQEKRSVGVNYRSDILTDAYLVMGDTQGSNLQELLIRDDVDPTHTTSNNVNEIIRTLGIEAARNFLIQELLASLNIDGSYIQPRHVFLLADFITNRGLLAPINFSGISIQDVGPLEMASFQKPMDAISNAAVVGEREAMNTVAGSLYVGNPPPVGESCFNNDIRWGRTISQERRAKYKADLAVRGAPTLDPNQVVNVAHPIDTMQNVAFGGSRIALDGSEFDDMFAGAELTTVPSYELETEPTTIRSGAPPPTKPHIPPPAGAVSSLLINSLNRLANETCTPTFAPPSFTPPSFGTAQMQAIQSQVRPTPMQVKIPPKIFTPSLAPIASSLPSHLHPSQNKFPERELTSGIHAVGEPKVPQLLAYSQVQVSKPSGLPPISFPSQGKFQVPLKPATSSLRDFLG